MKILIVDDHATNRKLLRAQLEAEHFEVIDAADGIESLEALKREPVSAVISDILMPRMDGYRLCFEIRKSREFCRLPVIIYTSTYTSPSDEKLSMEMGADKFIRKPASAAIIVESLREALRSTQHMAPRGRKAPEELTLMREYNERLVNKLERKYIELAAANEEMLRAQEQSRLQSAALATTANAVVITDVKGGIVWANPAFTSLTGYTESEYVGKTPRILKSGQHDQKFYRDFWRTILDGKTWRGEFINRHKDGHVYYGEHIVTPVVSEAGEITHFIGIMNDVTERKLAEERSRVAQEDLQLLMDSSPAVIYRLKIQGQSAVPVFTSENITRLLGIQPAETLRSDWWMGQLHPGDLERALATMPGAVTKDESAAEYRVRHRDGTYRWVHDSRRLIRDGAGQAQDLVGVWTDITERKTLEEEMFLREQQLNSFFRCATAGLAIFDRELRYVQVNETLAEMNGVPAGEHLGRTSHEIVPLLAGRSVPQLRRVIETGEPLVNSELSGETWRFPGVQRHWMRSAFPIAGLDGRPQGVGLIMVEVSDQKRAEENLRRESERLSLATRAASLGIWDFDVVHNRLVWDDAMYRLYGATADQFGGAYEAWKAGVHPDDRARADAEVQQALRGEKDFDTEFRVVWPDGSVHYIKASALVQRDESGRAVRMLGTSCDVTERKQLEAQLRQSQKMEAFGQLAGGVAHDFNNLLFVIMGYAGLLLDQEGLDAKVKDRIKDIFAAGERAANLTRQLLTFSRKKELALQAVDLNAVVANLSKMLGRIIGEQVKLRFVLGEHLPALKADEGMIEQALMNLVVNARDAMAKGGSLTISASKVSLTPGAVAGRTDARPGDFVCLSVQDTGCGMTPEIKAHIFEPFFTTKDVGRGTGLGLATVYGIVRQHEGWIEVESEIGVGTTFKIFLPALSRGARAADAAETPGKIKGGNETILIVEDDANVRMLARFALQRYGYQIIEAESGAHALALWNEIGLKVDLLLTDMVMPGGITGRELAKELTGLKPGLKVIYSSGYSREVEEGTFKLPPSGVFLQKPYHTRSLAQAVRELLDRD